MRTIGVSLPDVFIVPLPHFKDERGSNVNVWTKNSHLPFVAECNVVYSFKKGILRGIHYDPTRWKAYTCLRGAVFHVVVDIETGKWFGVEMSHSDRVMIVKHPRYGNSYQVLENDTMCLYLTNVEYNPVHEKVYRWDDPYFGISWPILPPILSKKDAEGILL